jgi:hypothetical protein
VQLTTVGVVLGTAATEFQSSWESLPAPIRDTLPPELTQKIAFGICALSLVARIFKQPSLPPAK